MPSWTTVPIWAVGQKIKAITLNLAVTAIGELQTWATAADAALTGAQSDITDLQAETFGTPYLLMRNTSAVTVTNAVPYNTVVTDTHAGWDAANFRYVVPRAGDYLAITQVMANAAATLGPNIRVNGSTRIGGGRVTELNLESGTILGVIQVAVGDLVDVQEGQASYTPHSASRNFFVLKYLGPT